MKRYFDDLKNKVLKHFPKPMTVNRFLRIHIDDLIGAANLFAPILKHFNMQRLPVSLTDSNFKTKDNNKLNLISSSVELTPNFQILEACNKTNDSDLRSCKLWKGLINENVLFEIDSEISIKQINDEILNNQVKIIVKL